MRTIQRIFSEIFPSSYTEVRNAMQTLELEKVDTIVHLIGVCNRCERVFAEVLQSGTCRDFQPGVGRIRQLLNEFGFQLRTELHRLDESKAGAFVIESEDDRPYLTCESSLLHVVESYRHALAGHLPPHTRAMVNRQYVQLRQLRDDLQEFIRILRGLVDDHRERIA
jgi:hypothetical protein